MRNITRKRKSRNSQGFTLVESMVATIVTMIVMSGTITVFVLMSRIMKEVTIINQINQETREFSDTLERDLRLAQGLESATDAGLAFFPYEVLVIKVPTVNEDGEVVDVINATDTITLETFDRVVYFMVDNSEFESGTSVVVRWLMPNASSGREFSAKVFGNIVKGNSYNGTFAAKPDALGAFVMHYEFTDSQSLRGKEYVMPISGSVKLRNKSL